MCFGNKESGRTETTNVSNPNPAVASAATGNLDFAQALRDRGFQGYGGEQVAGFSPQQQSSFNMTNAIANDGTAPAARSMIDSFASGPAQNVNSQRIVDNMSPYMNQYVMDALAPQLHQMDLNRAKDMKAVNSQATSSGAFGDARAGVESANVMFGHGVQREGVIGNAYNQAFNTAIGAGAQDTANNLAAQNANAGYNEAALGRQLQGANAVQGLQTQQLGVAGAQNTMGGQQTAQQQAQLTALYNQWLMGQQYPFQTAQLVNQTTGTGAAAMPASTTSTAVKSAPDNSGWAAGGALLGTAMEAAAPYAAAFMFSDERLKENIAHVGELLDGTPIYTYNYKGDPQKHTHLGVMAQEVKQRRPDAVLTLDDPEQTMMVDYAKATALSRSLAHAL